MKNPAIATILIAALSLITGCEPLSFGKARETDPWNVPDYSGILHGSEITAENTGVPMGLSLRTVTESITVTETWIEEENGGSRVLERRNFLSGAGLTVKADNVTVRYCKFTGIGGVTLPTDQIGISIEDCEFDGNQENIEAAKAIKNDAAELRLLRVHIHHWPRALTVLRGNTIVESCYLHDLTSDDSGAHIENVYVAGGADLAFIGNKIVANPASIDPDQNEFAVSASIAIYNQGNGLPDLDRILIERNYISGIGSFAVYGGAVSGKAGPFATNTIIRGNVFGREYMRKGGLFGPITAFDETGQGNQRANNTWGERGPYWVPGDPEAGDLIEIMP